MKKIINYSKERNQKPRKSSKFNEIPIDDFDFDALDRANEKAWKEIKNTK